MIHLDLQQAHALVSRMRQGDWRETDKLCSEMEAGGWFLRVSAYRHLTRTTPTGRAMTRPRYAWYNAAVWVSEKDGSTISHYINRADSKRYALNIKARADEQVAALKAKWAQEAPPIMCGVGETVLDMSPDEAKALALRVKSVLEAKP